MLFYYCRDITYILRRLNHDGAPEIKACIVTAKASFLNPLCTFPEHSGIPLNCSLFSLHAGVNKIGKYSTPLRQWYNSAYREFPLQVVRVFSDVSVAFFSLISATKKRRLG